MYTYLKRVSAFAMRSHFQIKNSSNKNSGRTSIPSGNCNSPSHQQCMHFCHAVIILPIRYVQVVNLPVHSHCPLFHTTYRMGTLLLTLPMLRVTWMCVKSYSHNSPHELHFTSLIFDFVYIASTRHA